MRRAGRGARPEDGVRPSLWLLPAVWIGALLVLGALAVPSRAAFASASGAPILPLPDADAGGRWLSVPPDVVAYSLTPMYVLQFEQSRLAQLARTEPDASLTLREGIERLARHLEGKTTVLALLTGAGAGKKPLTLSDPGRSEEILLQLGDIASLSARIDFLAGFMEYLIYSLLDADAEVPLPPLDEEVTLVFNLGRSGLAAGVAAQITGSGLHPFGSDLPADEAPLGVREITVKIRSESIRSEFKLDPADLTVRRGQLEVQFRLGPNTITSTTVFTKGEGLQKEVLVITAQIGDLSLTGQATWSWEDGSREFKLEATLAGLLSFSTLLTPEGLLEPTLGLELRF